MVCFVMSWDPIDDHPYPALMELVDKTLKIISISHPVIGRKEIIHLISPATAIFQNAINLDMGKLHLFTISDQLRCNITKIKRPTVIFFPGFEMKLIDGKRWLGISGE